jgi:hypothetical protein
MRLAALDPQEGWPHDVAALAAEHDGEGSHDPLRTAAVDLWHNVLTMSWKQEMPEELTEEDERIDHVGRSAFTIGVLAGSRMRLDA